MSSILKIKDENGNWVSIPAIKGEPGSNGTSVTVKSVSESTADGGSNVVTFSDGKTLTIKNGSKGSTGGKGADASVYATCTTDAATAAKVVTVVGDDSWELKVGKVVMVYFSNSNSASNVTLNVNNTGAYPIWYNNAEYTSTGTAYTGYANRVIEYMFNGTHWVWMGSSYDANSTYKNVTLGHGYVTCATAEATTAKVGTLASYTLTLGGIVAVKFTYAVPANATLNINSKGAKNMFYRGAKITAGVIKAGDIATFIYDGTQYQLLSVDRWQNDTVANATAIANLSSAKDDLVAEVETLKTSVSEGKALIASAVTDKGVQTADDATFATIATNINNISGGCGDIPTYHFVECARVLENIENFKTAHPNHLIFGAATDIHVFNGDATYEEKSKTSIRNAAFALEMVGAMAECDFIANLGDNCWENGIDTDNAFLGAKYSNMILKPGFDRLTSFNLVGNHDKSDNTQAQYNMIGVHNDFDVHSTTQIRGFGYKDFTDKKVRVIVLNTCDYLNASGGCAMSYEQKDFLMRALDLSAKSDASAWQILLLSHIPLDWNGGDYNYYTDLQAILKAYDTGTTASITVNSSYALRETPSNYATYSGGKLVYNYNGKNSAKIIANIHGHVHTNKISKVANTNIVRVATANTNPDLNKSESYPDYGDYSITTTEANKIKKVIGTAKDTSATFYCIDLTGQTIYAYGYGADIDRTAVYKTVKTYTVTLNLTNVTASNTATVVSADDIYNNTLTANIGYALDSVKVTMGGVDVTSSVYENGVIKISAPGSADDLDIVTGNIVITATAKAIATYKNIIDDVGTEDNVRLRSGGATSTAAGFASNYFPVKAGNIIRVKFPNGDRTKIPSNGVYCCLYSDTSGTLVAAYDGSTSATVLKNATTTGYEIHIPTSVNCSYARVAGGPNGAYTGWIVTVNEEIK